MKKLLVGIVVLIAVVGALFTAGSVYAQGQVPPTQPGTGWTMGGMMGGAGRGMMGGAGIIDDLNSPVHSAMVAALAEKLGVSTDELNAALAEGKTMWQVAEERGLSTDEITILMQEAHTAALEQAVSEGYLTSDQAEWMNGRMQQMQYQNSNFGGHCFSNTQN